MPEPVTSQRLVSVWLGLPSDPWPPDHYALLGLHPGDMNVQQIEERVHEKLLRLRPYQLHHPEQVTEAMNRLARAFTCLTDPVAKKTYDASLFQAAADGMPPPATGVGDALPSVDPLAWLFGPWSKLAVQSSTTRASIQTVIDWASTPPPCRIRAAAAQVVSPPLPEATPAAAAESAPTDPMREAVCSESARRGLGTRRGLYQRCLATRRLLQAWERAGKTLNQPDWRPTGTREARELIRSLRGITSRLEEFPPVLGEAGQEGFWVVSLARQEMIVPIFRALDAAQRETLARDWRDGRSLLTAHRRFLHAEWQTLRRTGRWGRLRRAADFVFHEHPLLWLIPAALLLVLLTHLTARLLQLVPR